MPGINIIVIKSMSFGGRCTSVQIPYLTLLVTSIGPLPSGVKVSSLCSAFSLHLCSPWLYHSHSHTHTRCMCSLRVAYFLLCFWARKALSPTPVVVTNSTSLLFSRTVPVWLSSGQLVSSSTQALVLKWWPILLPSKVVRWPEFTVWTSQGPGVGYYVLGLLPSWQDL